MTPVISLMSIAADTVRINDASGAPVRLDAALVLVVLSLVLWYLGLTLCTRFGLVRERSDDSTNWR